MKLFVVTLAIKFISGCDFQNLFNLIHTRKKTFHFPKRIARAKACSSHRYEVSILQKNKSNRIRYKCRSLDPKMHAVIIRE